MKQEETFTKTEAINDYQEHTLQTTKEITDSYLDSHKEIMKSFQLIWVPYVENIRAVFWDNWASPQRITESYTRTVSNCGHKDDSYNPNSKQCNI